MTITPRERQIVALRGAGHSYKAISASLGIADRTIAAHLAAARDKLNLGSCRQLGEWARSNGVLP